MDVDHVGRDVPAAALQLFNLLAIYCENLFRRGVARQIRGGLPAFVVDADARKVVAHFVLFAKRTIFIRDSKHSHRIHLLVRAAAESRGALGARPNQHFHQELQDFNMALGFVQVRTPSIKPMFPQKKSMDALAFRQRTIARCSRASADGRPLPRTTCAPSSISKNCAGVRLPLSSPVEVMAKLSGSCEVTALKFPLVPNTHPRV